MMNAYGPDVSGSMSDDKPESQTTKSFKEKSKEASTKCDSFLWGKRSQIQDMACAISIPLGISADRAEVTLVNLLKDTFTEGYGIGRQDGVDVCKEFVVDGDKGFMSVINRKDEQIGELEAMVRSYSDLVKDLNKTNEELQGMVKTATSLLSKKSSSRF